jgi:putative transcriptional regulator
MKCMQCGSAMRTTRENFLYGKSGLPVTLVGVEVSRCKKCGEFEVVIPKIEKLHRAIAMEVIGKRARLVPAEIRFLRKYLGWSGADLARRVGVSVGAVSRWENGREHMGPVADRLLRLMVAHASPDTDYPVEKLAEVAQETPAPLRLEMQPDANGWHAEAA